MHPSSFCGPFLWCPTWVNSFQVPGMRQCSFFFTLGNLDSETLVFTWVEKEVRVWMWDFWGLRGCCLFCGLFNPQGEVCGAVRRYHRDVIKWWKTNNPAAWEFMPVCSGHAHLVCSVYVDGHVESLEFIAYSDDAWKSPSILIVKTSFFWGAWVATSVEQIWLGIKGLLLLVP